MKIIMFASETIQFAMHLPRNSTRPMRFVFGFGKRNSKIRTVNDILMVWLFCYVLSMCFTCAPTVFYETWGGLSFDGSYSKFCNGSYSNDPATPTNSVDCLFFAFLIRSVCFSNVLLCNSNSLWCVACLLAFQNMCMPNKCKVECFFVIFNCDGRKTTTRSNYAVSSVCTFFLLLFSNTVSILSILVCFLTYFLIFNIQLLTFTRNFHFEYIIYLFWFVLFFSISSYLCHLQRLNTFDHFNNIISAHCCFRILRLFPGHYHNELRRNANISTLVISFRLFCLWILKS